MRGYSTTIGYGVKKILQEGKTLQINIFLVKNTKCKAIQPLCYGVTKISKEGKTLQINIFLVKNTKKWADFYIMATAD